MQDYDNGYEKVTPLQRIIVRQKAWWRIVGAPLFKKLEIRELAVWGGFFTVCVVVVTVLLGFINSFIKEQDEYAKSFFSTSRHEREYETLLQEEAEAVNNISHLLDNGDAVSTERMNSP